MLLTYKYGLQSSVKVVNLCAYQYHELKVMVAGADLGFLRGGANHSTGSLKQGV